MRYSPVLEEDAETALVNGVRRARGLAFKLKFVGIAGAPDRLVLLPGGRFFFVELKKTGGALEPSQELMFPRLKKRGFHVHVLTGANEVRGFLERVL